MVGVPLGIIYFLFWQYYQGVLRAVAKITTMPIVMIPAILMTLNGMQGWGINPSRIIFPGEDDWSGEES